MLRHFLHLFRALSVPTIMMLCATGPIGCVSTETHTKALTELDAAKKTSEQQAAELEALRKEAQAQADQLASLQQEREALTAQSNELQAKLAGLEQENGELNSELGNVRNQITDLEQEVARGNASAQEEIAKLQSRASDLEAEKTRIAAEREQLRTEQAQLAANLDQERQRLKAEEEERERLERERAAKEEEIRRLTSTQEALSKSLEDEIAKGNITIQQVRDRLTINMVDRILFDSGQAQIKPAGLKVLKQVADVLTTVSDKHIRVEGHTDNVPIGTKLQDRFKTNWELSTARATTVVRYLIEQGDVNREYLSATGYADTRPVASNDTDEGRTSNRRIEIVLYPKDLEQLAGELEQGTAEAQ